MAILPRPDEDLLPSNNLDIPGTLPIVLAKIITIISFLSIALQRGGIYLDKRKYPREGVNVGDLGPAYFM